MPRPETLATVRTVLTRALAGLAAVLLGAVIGLLGAFQHSRDVQIGSVEIPLGLVAGIVALVLAQVLARAALLPGAGPALVLVGWLIVVVVLGTSRPEGDLVIPAGTSGEGFLYGGFVVGLVVALILTVRGRSSSRADGATRA